MAVTKRTAQVGGSGRRYSSEARAIIFKGCSVSVLAEMFKMKRQNVERRLANCPVAALSDQGMPLYSIADAAQFLVRIKLTDEQVLQTLKTADPRDFPAMTNKMFWEGLAQRRKYEELTGDLWHTSDVKEVASSAFNAVRMALLLLPDELSDSAGLNEQQRTVVQDVLDNALETCRETLIDELRKPSRSGQQPAPEEETI